MKIVIADDMKETRNGIRKIISLHFPHCTIDGVFENGLQLTEYLEHHVPDLLITDIRMPGCNGLDACKKLREHSDSAKIILITAYQDFEYAKEAIKYRVHDLITKPYTREQMKEAISTALNQPADSSPITEQTMESRSQLFVKKAKEYVHENYQDINLSTYMVAEYLQLSPNYFGELFYRECNCKFNSYVNHVRMEAAKKLLSGSLLTIHDISIKVGIVNVQSFNRVFKEYVGMSPSDYRIRKLD